MKKILIIDDSALMRRVMSDIINKTTEYRVVYSAFNAIDALDYLAVKNDIDAIICDLNMPKMSGLEFLKEMTRRKSTIPIIIFSSSEDTRETITALELGAIEFIKKPSGRHESEDELFIRRIHNALFVATELKQKNDIINVFPEQFQLEHEKKAVEVKKGNKSLDKHTGNKLVALVCSTGGPKALQSVLPKLPPNLDAPMLVVQHMPAGFTNSLSARLNDLSKIEVKEAEENEKLQKGVVYIAKGGTHLTVKSINDSHRIVFDNTPPIGGLKPCGNIMYHSLCDVSFDEIICVVLTGMGADGTNGISELSRKKKIYVIAQDEYSSTVYGMPKAIYDKGLTDYVCSLDEIADAITKKVGVR
ncbi:MAG: chemotaxis-specific protein-glutamate methyltransferase CheB [Clostridium sp.]|nr:chemotaxis-specific protein-glutamate methyltransferase CheB [Clostridium sp.]MCM1397986.1 chemotaxis-specific protein-glutamate methyltransferase CheB [Clostridium sp.]MCM1459378.1 chemotaxis-specific protein-glutamate methyltransferase CheB [Bacteroides sp.]